MSWQAIGIRMMNTGLFLVVLRYGDKISFSMTVDPHLVPDEWVLIDHIRASLAATELAAVAAARRDSLRARQRFQPSSLARAR